VHNKARRRWVAGGLGWAFAGIQGG
jgi:hypothetical protein